MSSRKFYIADLHLGHKNVIGFDGRPFSSIEEMDETIIKNWNSVVTNNDFVYILGDMFWRNDNAPEILDKLKGKKVLIKGNHDRINSEMEPKFHDIKEYMEVTDGEFRVIMCHYPILSYKSSYNPNMIMLHGHVHNHTTESKYTEEAKKMLWQNKANTFDSYGNILNVGCMMDYMNYTPQTIHYLHNVLESQKSK